MWEPVSDGGASLVQIGSKKNRYALMASYKSLILKLLSIINWLLLSFNYSSSRFFENQPNENCSHLRALGWYYTIIIIYEVATENRTKNLKESGYEVGQTLETSWAIPTCSSRLFLREYKKGRQLLDVDSTLIFWRRNEQWRFPYLPWFYWKREWSGRTLFSRVLFKMHPGLDGGK